MNGLAPRERKLIAVALLLALVAGVWLGVLRPVIDGFTERADQRAQALDDYARNARIIRSYRRLRAVAQVQAQGAPAFEIVAASPGAAAEIARDRLGRDLAASGAVVHAVRSQAAVSQTAEGKTVRLRADFQVGLAGLTTLLRRVHDQAPGGLVEGLSVASVGPTPAERSPALEVRLDVSFAYAAPL